MTDLQVMERLWGGGEGRVRDIYAALTQRIHQECEEGRGNGAGHLALPAGLASWPGQPACSSTQHPLLG